MSRYLNLLGASTARAGSLLCVGIDPVPSALPVTFRESHAGIERWIDTLIAAAMPHAASFKMTLAYFEASLDEELVYVFIKFCPASRVPERLTFNWDTYPSSPASRCSSGMRMNSGLVAGS